MIGPPPHMALMTARTSPGALLLARAGVPGGATALRGGRDVPEGSGTPIRNGYGLTEDDRDLRSVPFEAPSTASGTLSGDTDLQHDVRIVGKT